MKRKLAFGLVVVAILALALTVYADKPPKTGPTRPVPGNGYPCGFHYNLNILAKWDHFTCPCPEYDDSGNQVFGNVIFNPREQGDDPITILMESGRKGPKNQQDQDPQAFRVTDWCTESFPDCIGDGQHEADGDWATLELPKNEEGYLVFGRIAGKPGEDGEPHVVISPDLYYVQDESENDLVLFGMIDGDGVWTFMDDSATLYRSDATKSGRGVKQSTNLTPLFQFSGTVCYPYEEGYGTCSDPACAQMSLCCVDSEPDRLGYERCDLLAGVGIEVGEPATTVCPTTDVDGYLYYSVEGDCVTYEDKWVFNIAEFVGYLWDITNEGAYNIKIRFYPLPLNEACSGE